MKHNTSKAIHDQIAIIDIGSNSVRFVIYEIHGAAFTPIYNEKILAGLGRDLQRTGNLHVEGVEQAFSALKRYKVLVNELEIETVLIAATAAMRDAKDAPAFIKRVKDEIGFDITPLSGAQEAFVSAMGVVSGDVRSQGIAVDLGGASLELIEIKNAHAQDGVTYPLGPFSMFENSFDPVEMRARIKAELDNGQPHKTGQDLFLIGGAWRNLFIIHQKRTGYPLRVANNYRLEVDEANTLAQWAYSEEGVDIIKSWRGLSSRRADTLPYSGLLLTVLLDILKPRSVIVAPGGLREGLVYNSLSREVKSRTALFDACHALAGGGEEGIGFGQSLFDFLNGLDARLPKYFSYENENRLRKAACILASLGKGLHPDHKARMVFRAVIYAPLPDISHEERAYLALMLFSSYTSKTSTPNDEVLTHFLSDEAQLSARIYGDAMRLGADISGRSHKVLLLCHWGNLSEKLHLNIQHGYEDLFTDKVDTRLADLNALITSAHL